MLVATSVVALLVLLVTQLINHTTAITTLGHKRMEADAQARPLFDRMSLDFAQLIKRNDVSYYLKTAETPMPGNDLAAFYSAVDGYYPTTPSPISVVAYRVNGDASNLVAFNSLERMGKGLDWNGVAPGSIPVVFLPLTIHAVWPSVASSAAYDDSDPSKRTYEIIGPQVFRFEYYYLEKNGGNLVAYPAAWTATIRGGNKGRVRDRSRDRRDRSKKQGALVEPTARDAGFLLPDYTSGLGSRRVARPMAGRIGRRDKSATSRYFRDPSLRTLFLYLRPVTSLFSSNQTSRRGAALVLVLALIVLLSGLLLAYLVRSGTDRQLAHASFQDTKSDLLARSALDLIVADLKREIADGSGINPANIQPRRWGTPAPGGTPFSNLIRRSVQGDPTGYTWFSSSGPSATGTPKRGDISAARWNSHYLLPRAFTSGNDSTPAANFAAPDWVLLTTQGPSATPAPGSVIGRYAYAVYDEGGTLDVNVAGFPYYGSASQSPTPGLPLHDIGRKGIVAFADLRALPATASTTLSAGGVNAIVGWRNYATLHPSSTFPNFTFDLPGVAGGTGARFVDYFAGNPPIGLSRDFRTVSPTVYLNRTDQAFLTRTQLIRLQREAGFSAGALQNLGTFSREINAPTWKAGTASLLQRFYLGHLNLIRPNPPAARMADIQKQFGLKWVSGVTGTGVPPAPTVPGHWQYVGASGNTMQDRIAAFTTDPDFFQLLNYALNRTNADDSNHLNTTLSIGAALIDQYDDDSAADPLTGTTTTMIGTAADGLSVWKTPTPPDPAPRRAHHHFRPLPACRPLLLRR